MDPRGWLIGVGLVAAAVPACLPPLKVSLRPAPGVASEPALPPASLVKAPPPAENAPPPIRFLMYGDAGTGDAIQMSVAARMGELVSASPLPVPFALVVGDNIYPAGASSADDPSFAEKFEKPYAPLISAGVVFYTVLGNHDVYTLDGQAELDYARRVQAAAALAQRPRPGWYMPDRSYKVARQEGGGIAVFALDSSHESIDVSQLSWLARELPAQTARWKVVFAHHPVYSTGSHGDTPNFPERLAPVLETGGAHFYFSGHDHNFDHLAPVQGVNYFLTGGAGKVRADRSVSRNSSLFFLAEPHFMYVEGTADWLHLSVINDQGERRYSSVVQHPSILAARPITWCGMEAPPERRSWAKSLGMRTTLPAYATKVLVDGVTEVAGAGDRITVELGVGPWGANPLAPTSGYRFVPARFEQDAASFDVYTANVPADLALGAYQIVFRARFGDGAWIYCDRASDNQGGSTDGISSHELPALYVE